jgi:hypothetical protein
MELFGYRFLRVENYREKLQCLQHPINFSHEFSIVANTGNHAVTAKVILPEVEEKACLDWSDRDKTALMDILLLLSLFTQREVFAGDPELYPENIAIRRDPRVYQWGGTLSSSIEYKEKWLDEDIRYNIGFEESIEQVYTMIRSDHWQKKYRNGYFLFWPGKLFILKH